MDWIQAVLVLVMGLIALVTIPVLLWGIGALIALKMFERRIRR